MGYSFWYIFIFGIWQVFGIFTWYLDYDADEEEQASRKMNVFLKYKVDECINFP